MASVIVWALNYFPLRDVEPAGIQSDDSKSLGLYGTEAADSMNVDRELEVMIEVPLGYQAVQGSWASSTGFSKQGSLVGE